MKLENWSHSEITVLCQSKKKGSYLLTLGLRGTTNKYHFILSGDAKSGFSIKCLTSGGRKETSIKRFVHYYIEQEIKKYLYKNYPSLELKELFAGRSYIETTFESKDFNKPPKVKEYFQHFSSVIFATLIAICAIAVCSILIVINESLLPLLLIAVLAVTFYKSTKDVFKSKIIQYQVFNHYRKQVVNVNVKNI
ncbi:hypothetical protein [Priestia aryabhattai]